MTVAESAAVLLEPSKLPLPKRPKVVEIRVQPYVDHLGYDSLEVWVIVDEDTTDKDLNAKNGNAIFDAIGDALRDGGIDLFPYIHVGSWSEIREAGIEV